MITIPTWILAITILIFPVYLLLDRVWTTFDNWLKERTLNPRPRRPIGFDTQKENKC